MSALEELKSLLDGSQGESIDVPHPNTFKNTEVRELTKWYRSEAPSDAETNMLGAPLIIEDRNDPQWGRPLSYVHGCIASVVVLDSFNEQHGHTQYVVLHKVVNPKVTNKDISSTPVSPHNIRDLRRRFPSAFAEFEKVLAAQGVPLPIDVLDDIPPHVVSMLKVKGAKAVADFAAYGDKEMAGLKSTLEASKMHARVPYIERYRQIARDKIGYVDAVEAPKAPRTKVAA